MLEEVFGGFAPEQEMEALLSALQHFGGDITFDHIMTSVAAVAGARAAAHHSHSRARGPPRPACLYLRALRGRSLRRQP